MSRNIISIILISIAVLSQYFLGCSEETVTNPTTYVHDTTLVTAYDTVFLVDTVVVVDTVEIGIELEGEWLKFSAYEASKAFVKENYPERADDRFSRMGTFCNYSTGTPAGRAGFKFVDNGDGTYVTEGYTYEYLFGAIGFVWGAAQGQPTEKTYNYGCTLRLDENNDWILLNISMGPCGDYIRDTRHD